MQDPFKAASELLRIVKPNGILIVDWPFLQPEHGYPHHYFNATREGARITFTRLSEDIEVDVSVPTHMHPMATYRWFLESWLKGLESKLSKLIFLITPPLMYLSKPWNEQLSKKVSQLSQAQQPIIASGFRIRVKNKK